MPLPFANCFVPAVNDFARTRDRPRVIQFLDLNSLGYSSSDCCMVNTFGQADNVDEAKRGMSWFLFPFAKHL